MLLCVLSTLGPAHTADAPKKPGGQKWAVLIGVDDYTELRKLRFAGNDQRALAEQLVAIGFPKDNVYLLHNKATDKKYLPSGPTSRSRSTWSWAWPSEATW